MVAPPFAIVEGWAFDAVPSELITLPSSRIFEIIGLGGKFDLIQGLQ